MQNTQKTWLAQGQEKEMTDIADGLWPSARWEVAVCDPETQNTIMEAVAEGTPLRAICKANKWPYSYVARWIAENPEVNACYEAALAIWGDSLAQETPGIADDAEPSTVAHAKLRVDTRLKLASRWNRQRYGETPQIQINAASGSLVAILSALPPLPPAEPIDAIAEEVKEEKEYATPKELKDKNDSSKTE